MATKTLQYKIGMDLGELRRNAVAAGTYTAGFRKELEALEKKQRDHRKSLEDMGRGMAVFGTAVVAGLGLAAKAAIDWESAWTGVRKTVDGSDEEMAQLEGELRQLARTLPASHREIAAVAEAAGQLGIKRKDIAAFTKTMVDLGQTTNLTADEAATALAKFSNIMGTSASDADRLGSALVALGNDGASTEKDIVEMALRIAGAGKQLKLSESQVLGFASALSSMGILAEGGGSSISTTMVTISKAVTSGGEKLEAFAAVAGMSADKFRQSFQQDAGAAVVQFIVGLGKMQKTGGDVFGTLAKLGLQTNEVRDTLLRAAGGSDLFTRSLRVGSTAWAENTALTEEANKRYATSASKIQVAWNQIQDALIDVGATVVPIVSSLTTGIGDIVRAFQSLPGPVRDVVTWVGLAAGGITLLGGAALIAGPKITAFRAQMTAMAATGGATSKALGAMGGAIVGPLGIALAAGAVLLGIWAMKSGEAKRKQAELGAAAKGIADVIKEQNYVINEAVIKATALTAAEKGMITTAEKLGIAKGVVTEAILGQGTAYEDLRRVLFEKMKAATEHDGVLGDEAQSIAALIGNLDTLHGDTQKQTDLNKAADVEVKKATEGQKRFGDQLGLTDEELEQAAEALGKLIQVLDDTNRRTLSARSAGREFLASIADAKAAITAAAEARVQAAERVQSAEQTLARTQRSTIDAQDGLTRAQRDGRDAQLALTRAREQEVERLEDLNRAVSSAALDEEGAVLSLERAKERLNEEKGKGTGGLDLREAELGVRRAEMALVDTRDRYADIQKEAAAANRAGVEGSDAVISAHRGVADAARAIQQAQQGVADAAGEVRDALKEVVSATKELNLLGNARTLDKNTEAGRRNAEMLDKVAENANALAVEAAHQAEKVGGAAAAAAALTTSLKASRPALIDTAMEFGMSREEAEKYADSVLAVPDTSSVAVVTPGSRESLAELQRVRAAVQGIPPNKSVNVAAPSEAAIKELERIGFKVEGLPDGTVNVTAYTATAYQELDRLFQTYQNRSLGIHVTPTGQTYYQGQGGRYYAAQGGIVAFAGGGMHEDHRPQIARARAGTVRVWAEKETDRESYIPWAMDRRTQATGVLRTTANGFGYDLMPRGIPVRAFSMGGVTGGGSYGSWDGRITFEVVGGDSAYRAFLAQSLQKFVRVTAGGNVQAALGTG